MSDHTTTTDPAGTPTAGAAPRTISQRVISQTLSRTGAKVGATWIGLLTIAAVFAPLMANSHPVLVRTDDHGWVSPLLKHLTPADVTLLIAFFTGVFLALARGALFRHRVAFLTITAAAVAVITTLPSLPDTLRSYRLPELADTLAPFAEGHALTYISFGVALTAALTAALTLTRMRDTSIAVRAALLTWLILVCLAPAVMPVRPPAAVVYSQYREAAATGTLGHAWHAPIPFSPTDYQRDQDNPMLQAPSARHWLGTDNKGADLFSRMIHASRIALSIGLISTSIAFVIGVVVGSVMGYFSGVVDIVGMRLVEIVESIPTLFLLIIFVSFLGRNLYMMMVIIGLTSWTGYCRFIRAEYLKLRQQDFIQAARAAALPLWSILFRHMLPNGVAPVLVGATFGVASAILAETTLSFLGLGLVDEPSWGEMLNQVLAVGGTFHWWLATFPGLAIFLTVFAYNLIGESLRDAIDPHHQQRPT